jgi:hypothetical protein
MRRRAFVGDMLRIDRVHLQLGENVERFFKPFFHVVVLNTIGMQAAPDFLERRNRYDPLAGLQKINRLAQIEIASAQTIDFLSELDEPPF